MRRYDFTTLALGPRHFFGLLIHAAVGNKRVLAGHCTKRGDFSHRLLEHPGPVRVVFPPSHSELRTA